MRYVYLSFGFLVVLIIGAAGFRGSLSTKPPIEIFPDMDRQPKVKSQSPSAFYGDGRSDRPLVPNTVHRGVGYGSQEPVVVTADGSKRAEEVKSWSADTLAFNTGKNADGSFVTGFPAPFAVTAETMARGQNRYNIYCIVCHGALGDGNGITKTYGMSATPTYHDQRLRTMANGEIFNTITHGKNLMGPYGDKLDAADRWAVILYVRALQRAENGKAADLTEGARKDLGL